MSDIPKIGVTAEIRESKIHTSTYELLGKARELADKIKGELYVIILADKVNQEELTLTFKAGADYAIVVENEVFKHFDQDVMCKVCKRIISEYDFKMILAPATTSWRSVLPALAAKLNTGLTADCTGLDIEPDTHLLIQTRPAIGGNVIATIKTPKHKPQMATVRPKNFPLPDFTYKSKGKIIKPEIPKQLFKSRVQTICIQKEDQNISDIQQCEIIVSGGKGLKKKENFAMLFELASFLKGGVGASRAAVEMKFIPYAHQVGLSGKAVTPKIYFAIGISGSVQHIAGMQSSKYIISINKDPQAPIFNISDIAICGDLFEVVPRLIQKIKEEKGSVTR